MHVCEHVRRGRGRGREMPEQTPQLSTEPEGRVQFDPMTQRQQPELKPRVCRLTDHATQAPQPLK